MTHTAAAIHKARIQLAGDLTLTGVVGHEAPVYKKDGVQRLIRRVRDGDLRADSMIIAEGLRAVWAERLGFPG